jgi:Protein of unknown function (DUF3592)
MLYDGLFSSHWRTFMDIKWIAAFFLAPLIIVLGVATVVKYIEVRRARSWRAAEGKIIASRSAVRSHSVPGPGRSATTSELRNFADVKYAFKVGDVSHKGTRISIGEDLGNTDVAEKLARYPVGAHVTVYYNPKDPTESVLERDPPPGLFQGMAWFLALLVSVGVLAGTGLEAIEAIVREHVPSPRTSPLVVGLLVMSGFVFLIGRALRIEAAKTSTWRETTGQVAKTTAPPSGDTSAHRFAYVYTVNGIEYVSDRVSFGGTTRLKVKGQVVDTRAKKYPAGTVVRVFYDPLNPAQAVLEKAVAGLWIVRAIGIALAIFAMFVATYGGS